MEAEDFPPKAVSWIKDERVKWEGPREVQLDEIDFGNKDNWKAAKHGAKLAMFERKIKAGDRKPVVLARIPGRPKLVVIDGHHRALAHFRLKRSLRAYIGHVPTRNGPWDKMHAMQRQSGQQPRDVKLARQPQKQRRAPVTVTQAQLTAVSAVLAGSLATPAAMASAILAIIPGLELAALTASLALVARWPKLPQHGTGPGTRTAVEENELRRAAFLINCYDRLVETGQHPETIDAKLEDELHYFDQHLQASAQRDRAGSLVDSAAETYGGLLGWYASKSGPSTPECQDADGKNFWADHPPLIGYPGFVHANCKCSPGKPFTNAPVLLSHGIPFRVIELAGEFNPNLHPHGYHGHFAQTPDMMNPVQGAGGETAGQEAWEQAGLKNLMTWAQDKVADAIPGATAGVHVITTPRGTEFHKIKDADGKYHWIGKAANGDILKTETRKQLHQAAHTHELAHKAPYTGLGEQKHNIPYMIKPVPKPEVPAPGTPTTQVTKPIHQVGDSVIDPSGKIGKIASVKPYATVPGHQVNVDYGDGKKSVGSELAYTKLEPSVTGHPGFKIGDHVKFDGSFIGAPSWEGEVKAVDKADGPKQFVQAQDDKGLWHTAYAKDLQHVGQPIAKKPWDYSDYQTPQSFALAKLSAKKAAKQLNDTMYVVGSEMDPGQWFWTDQLSPEDKKHTYVTFEPNGSSMTHHADPLSKATDEWKKGLITSDEFLQETGQLPPGIENPPPLYLLKQAIAQAKGENLPVYIRKNTVTKEWQVSFSPPAMNSAPELQPHWVVEPSGFWDYVPEPAAAAAAQGKGKAPPADMLQNAVKKAEIIGHEAYIKQNSDGIGWFTSGVKPTTTADKEHWIVFPNGNWEHVPAGTAVEKSGFKVGDYIVDTVTNEQGTIQHFDQGHAFVKDQYGAIFPMPLTDAKKGTPQVYPDGHWEYNAPPKPALSSMTGYELKTTKTSAKFYAKKAAKILGEPVFLHQDNGDTTAKTGWKWNEKKPPGTEGHIVVNPDGSTKTVKGNPKLDINNFWKNFYELKEQPLTGDWEKSHYQAKYDIISVWGSAKGKKRGYIIQGKDGKYTLTDYNGPATYKGTSLNDAVNTLAKYHKPGAWSKALEASGGLSQVFEDEGETGSAAAIASDVGPSSAEITKSHVDSVNSVMQSDVWKGLIADVKAKGLTKDYWIVRHPGEPWHIVFDNPKFNSHSPFHGTENFWVTKGPSGAGQVMHWKPGDTLASHQPQLEQLLLTANKPHVEAAKFKAAQDKLKAEQDIANAIAKIPAKQASDYPQFLSDFKTKAAHLYTETEKSALLSYQGGGYTNINDSLRKQNNNPNFKTSDISPGTMSKIKNIDKAMQKWSTPFDITVTRKIGHANWLPNESIVGKTIIEHGYSSTSFDDHVWSGHVKIYIQVPKGTHAINFNGMPYSSHPNEKELLLPRDSHMVCVEDKLINGVRILVMQMLNINQTINFSNPEPKKKLTHLGRRYVIKKGTIEIRDATGPELEEAAKRLGYV